MHLPTIIIFERHWDEIPKLLATEILPDLADLGYDTCCVEAGDTRTSEHIIESCNENIRISNQLKTDSEKYLKNVNIVRDLTEMSYSELCNILRLYVSSQRFQEVAEKIKGLPANLLLKNFLEKTKQYSVEIKGIDHVKVGKIVSSNVSDRDEKIDKYDDLRTETFVKNLFKISHEKSGSIFICGALHAAKLISNLKEKKLNVLYYFPHSSKRYDDSFNDIEYSMNDTLRGNTFKLLKDDVGAFKKKILKDIKSCTKYKAEVLNGNSHTRYLSNLFGVEFKAFLRPRFFVDGVLSLEEVKDSSSIFSKLKSKEIECYEKLDQGKKFLVIPDVNTGSVIEKLYKI